MFKLSEETFEFDYFYHTHNCGVQTSRRLTERTVELSVADFWLNKISNPWEVGAVTPYYWLDRCKVIIDPADKHPCVNIRKSLMDVDLTNKKILSISTIEHVGLCEYGLTEKVNAVSALLHIIDNAKNYLITFPYGYNALLDDFIVNYSPDKDHNIYFLCRNNDKSWVFTKNTEDLLPYGSKSKPWANSVIFMEYGNLLNK